MPRPRPPRLAAVPASPPSPRARPARSPAAPAANTPAAPRVARALVAGVLSLLALRVLAALMPGRVLWGLDLGRDLPLVPVVLATLVTAASCLPAVRKRLEHAVPERGAAGMLLAAAGVTLLAAFAWNHPDRALITGDTRLRQGSFVTIERPEEFAPQALAGDLWLHHTLPRQVSAGLPITPGDVGRAQGALLVVVTALAGLALARECGLRGLPALAIAAATCGTAALALDTGYAKASAEVAALTSVLAVAMARAARTGRGLLLAGASVALALLLHRSALALVPAWLAIAVIGLRSGTLRGPGAWFGVLAPLAALAAVGPRLWQIVSSFDAMHHVPPASSLFSFAHAADVVNLLVLLAPAVMLLPLLAGLAPRPAARETLLALSLVLPALALLVVFRPQQGLPRDWDVFAFTGSACAALAAWRAGIVLTVAPGSRGVAVALALVALVPALQWTAIQADADRMWARAESVLVGPPERDREERALGLAALGLLRYAGNEREAAHRLFRLSYAASPHPRRLVEWGIVANLVGQAREALGYFEQAVAIRPDLASAWQGVLESAMTLSDAARAREAIAALERLEPANPALPAGRAWLGIAEGDRSDSGRR